MEELSVKGIILDARPQGEYGRRLTMLTDKLGKVTVFAQGAAKIGSKLSGAARPFTAAEFLLAKGKNAFNLHGASVMDAFSEIPMDPDVSMYGFYVLEIADYFSAEGMPEEEAKALLNLSFMTLSALRKKELSPWLISAICELRLMKLEGEYTELPGYYGNASDRELTDKLWKYILNAPLTRLYKKEVFEGKDVSDLVKSCTGLFSGQVPHTFRSMRILHDL